jgi:isovaleryl-CoA dehydrogenase
MAACMDAVRPSRAPKFGQSISEFQLMQNKLADMYSTWQATRAYVYAVGKTCDRSDRAHLPQGRGRAILYSAEKATWMAGEAVRRWAARLRQGLSGRAAVARRQLYEIGAGTSEIGV